METIAARPTDTPPVHLIRPVQPHRLLAFAAGRDLPAILHGQHTSPEAFFSQAGPNPARDLLAAEQAGRITGWACTHKFHERPGYAPTLRYDADFLNAQAATALFAACAATAAASGARRLVSLLRSDSQDRLRWYRGSFLAAGRLALPEDLELLVFIRPLA